MRTTPETKPLRIAALLMLSAFAQTGFAQPPAPAVATQAPAKPLDNYTIQRLIIANDKGEVLLEKNAFGWMTPALRSSKRESVREALDGLASELGLRVEAIQLAGLHLQVRRNPAESGTCGDLVQEPLHSQVQERAARAAEGWQGISMGGAR